MSNEAPNLSIKLPTMEEQKSISACLSSIDQLIENHTQQLEDLKTHRQLLMAKLLKT